MERQENYPTYSRFFRRLFFLLLFALMANLAQPCGWIEEEPSFCFFDQRVIRTPLFQHFFNIHAIYEDSGMPGTPLLLDEKIVMQKEWGDYFKEIAFSTEKPGTLLFDTKPEKLKAALSKTGDTPANQKYRDVYRYLLFVNDAKPYVEPKEEEWGGGALPPPKDEKVMKPLLETAITRAGDKTLNPFLRLRYGFQAVRLAVFLERYPDAISYYDRYVAPIGKGMIQYWALGYRARALFLSGKRVDALQVYLDIYDQYPPMMEKAMLSIKRLSITEKDWKECITKITSKHKQATAWMMRSLLQSRDYSTEALKHMIESEPGSIRQEALLIRIIQTIEKYNFEDDAIHFFQKNKSKNRYTELIALCKTVGESGKAKQPALWWAAGAYLSLLQGDKTQAEQYLLNAKQEKTPNPLMERQIHIMETLLTLQEINSLSETASIDTLKRMTLDDVKWYGGEQDKTSHNRFISKSLLFLASYWFHQKGDPIRYDMLTYAGHYAYQEYKNTFGMAIDSLANDTQLQEFEKLLANPQKHPFDAWLIANYNYCEVEDVIFLRAVKNIRQDQMEKALQQFSRLSPAYWKKIDAEENYSGRVTPGAETPGSSDSLCFLRYNKIKISRDNAEFDKNPKWEIVKIMDFCKIIKELKEQAKRLEKSDPAGAARVYLALGNIYYNLRDIGYPDIGDHFRRRYSLTPSYYPLCFMDLKYTSVQATIDDKMVVRNLEMDNFLKAEKFYTRVIELTPDRELAAKCCILVSTSRNIYLYTDLKTNPTEFGCANRSRYFTIKKDFKKSKDDLKYFYLLAQKYKDTDFYRTYSMECPILKMFE